MRGNLVELASLGIASEPTLRRWIDEKPEDTAWIIKRGTGKGDPYDIDLEGALDAWKSDQDKKADEDRARSASLKQLSLDMGLSEAAKASDHAISFKEQQALLEIEVTAIKLGKLRGDLVPVAGVQAAIGDMFIAMSQRGASFSGRLAKKIDLSREQLNAIDALIRQDQALLADDLERMDYAGATGTDDPADPAISDGQASDSEPSTPVAARRVVKGLAVGRKIPAL
jgi:hypothetical protein